MKTIRSDIIFASAALLLAIAPMAHTAESEATEQAKLVKERIEALRLEVVGVRHQVGLTLEALNRMQSESVDLREQFTKYTESLVKMETQAKLTRERAEAMGKAGMAFFKAWEEQVGSIANTEVRELARSRLDKRTKSYQKIVAAMGEARDSAGPLMSDLKDIKTLLASELSRETVGSAKKLIQQANFHAADVAESLVDVETQLDRVGGELAKYK